MSGSSSSGCGASTAAGLPPISLGSDTDGSLGVPAALCGVFSLKPTDGPLPRSGTFSFVDSLDHIGPFARTPRDLGLACDVLQGHDAGDHACAARQPEPALDRDPNPLRIGLPDAAPDRAGNAPAPPRQAAPVQAAHAPPKHPWARAGGAQAPPKAGGFLLWRRRCRAHLLLG